MKIKVNKAKLIAAMEAKVKAASTEYEEGLKKWEVSCIAIKKEWLDKIAELQTQVKAGKFSPDYGPKLDGHWPYWPIKPKPYKAITEVEALVRKLHLIDGEVIEIDDKSDYFAFI